MHKHWKYVKNRGDCTGECENLVGTIQAKPSDCSHLINLAEEVETAKEREQTLCANLTRPDGTTDEGKVLLCTNARSET